jgi:hypothetical protein
MNLTSVQYVLYIIGSLCFLGGSCIGWFDYLNK